MTAAPMTLGTAGHIDHGKTALIEALTGVNTDRLPQERARGISIELGFAQLELPSGRRLSVVDVPGHERFVRTMVAGASGIDLFLMVVAADDGVMPQTREHLAVIELLEVPAGVVALTKIDLVDAARREQAAAGVRALLSGGPYAEAPVVPVSTPRADGLADLLAALERVATVSRDRPFADGAGRLHVDRCFTLRGIGTVVTGTLWSGRMTEGEEVRIEPGNRRARVRSVQVHDARRPFAEAGQRVALNLAGVERHQVARGDVVLTGETDLAPTYLVDATVRMLRGAPPLKRGARVHVHHGTRESPARVAPLEGETVGPGERALVQLRLDRAIVAARGDRLVLRQVAPPDTVGGAVVLDPRPRKHGPGESYARKLHAIESGDPLEALRLELENAPSGLDGERGADLLERLEANGEAVRVGATDARWFAPAQLEHARRELLRALSRPEPGRGLNRGALAAAAGLDAAGAGALLDQLAAEGEVREREGAYVSARAPSARDAPLGRELLELLGQDGHTPRATGALATAAGADLDEVTRMLGRLAGEGAVVRLQMRLYYEAGALDRAQRAVVELCERDGSVTIAGLRDALGTSRKHAQAILEHLDARRVTRRVGDEHVLRARF